VISYKETKKLKDWLIAKNNFYMNYMKKIFIMTVALLVLGAAILIAPSGQSKVKPYYSGDTVNFNGKIYIGSTNSGKFELLALENGHIYRKAVVASSDIESKEFYDLLFDKVGGKLYAYLVNGRYLYRYDITNPLTPIVDLKIKDNSWDWFSRVDKVGGNIVTVGSKGTKVWNKDFQVINSYAMINNSVLGTAKLDGQMAFNLKDKLSIYNTVTREKVAEYAIAVNDKQASRGLSVNSDKSLIYLVDDKSFKAVGFDGKIKNQFNHISNAGYDVAVSRVNPDRVYFSDGVGVVKMDKETFKPVSWAYTTANNPAGSWAMGLSVVNDGASEKLVIFNGSNILVLDQNMKEVADYESVEQDVRPTESLFLNIDKNRGAVGTQVSVVGGGFGLNENLVVKFAGIDQVIVKTDANGRFKTVLTVPTLLPGGVDIKVIGKTTKKTYSVGFKVE
jgi:hypothetical protein